MVTRTVDTHITALRQRLEADAEDPRLILTVWMAGYRVAGGPTEDFNDRDCEVRGRA